LVNGERRGKDRGAGVAFGNEKKRVVRGRRMFCQLAVGKMGYPGAEVARFLGVTTSSVNRLLEEMPDLRRYLKML